MSAGDKFSSFFREILRFVKSCLIFTELRHGVDELGTSKLEDGTNNPSADSQTKGCEVHARVHWRRVEEVAHSLVAYNEELNVELTNEDKPEPEV